MRRPTLVPSIWRRGACVLTVALSIGLLGRASAWQVHLDDVGVGAGTLLALDGSSNVLAGGWVYRSPPPYDSEWVVAKFDGANGTEAWRWFGHGTHEGGVDYPFDDQPFA